MYWQPSLREAIAIYTETWIELESKLKDISVLTNRNGIITCLDQMNMNRIITHYNQRHTLYVRLYALQIIIPMNL